MKRLVLIAFFGLVTGCGQHYVTPGGAASMAMIAGEDFSDIEERTEPSLRQFYSKLPASYFPANLAVIRVQDAGYQSHTYYGHWAHRSRGSGRYTVITTREIESDEAVTRIENLPMIDDVAAIGRMLVPSRANSIRDLRIPAAQLQADMLLVYTVDTAFDIAGKTAGPMTMLSLGLFRNQTAHVSSTVSGMLVDVRTGFIYGTLEATERREKKTNVWSSRVAIDTARIEAEKAAFEGFADEFSVFWRGVTASYAATNTGNATPRGSKYHTVEFDH